MNRKFTFAALMGALVLFASCSRDVNAGGSVGFNTGAVARQIFGSGMSRQVDGLDTSEFQKGLKEFVDQNFKINFKLTLSGSYNGTATQSVSAWNFLWADIAGSANDESYILRIKHIPAGSSVNVKVEASLDMTEEYEEKIEFLIDEFFEKLPSADLKYKVLNRFSATQYRDLKFEGSTSAPVRIHAGKNTARIELVQAGGIKLNGGFSLDLESSDSLGLLVENNYEENYISIKPADSNYEFVRVEYIILDNTATNDSPATIDLYEKTEDIKNDAEVGENSVYTISLDKDELLISSKREGDRVNSFFFNSKLYFIARNKITGKYKTTVYKGL